MCAGNSNEENDVPVIQTQAEIQANMARARLGMPMQETTVEKNRKLAEARAKAGPMIPPAPSLTAMMIGERLTPKVGVDVLKLPLISSGGLSK